MLDIILLGSGGGLPLPNRYLSSIVLGYKGRKILIDCGEGTQVAMREFHTGFKSLDIICITHIHGDHLFGLPGLLSTMGNSERVDPITIIGPPGIYDAVKGLTLTIYLPYHINIIEVQKDTLEIISTKNGLTLSTDLSKKGDISVSTIRLDHSADCIGYSFYINRKPAFLKENAINLGIPQNLWGRLQYGEDVQYEGKLYNHKMVLGHQRPGIKVSITTDTRPTEDIPEFIENSDLFICEGTYGDHQDQNKAIVNKHMTFEEAAVLAKKGNVDQLLLTHFSPAVDHPMDYIENAKSIFENTELGHDGLKFTLKFKD
ncbi:MAG: ribonuclease Z [Tissierella sp.]|nr:ribonuclease Z [Tissierella sp.]